MIIAIIILIGIFAIVSAFIASTNKMYDGAKKGLKRITLSGWVFISCGFILVALPVIQKFIEDDKHKDEQETHDQKLKKEYNSSVLIMKKEFDKSNEASITKISTALGKYGFALDSTTLLLRKLRDSIKIAVTHGNDPVLGIADNGVRLDEVMTDNKYKFRIIVQSKDGGSAFFRIKWSFIIGDTLGMAYYSENSGQESPMEYSERIPQNNVIDAPVICYGNGNGLKSIFIWIRGSYKRVDGSGNFKIDDLYAYYLGNKRLVQMKGETRKRMIGLINKNEKKK